MSSVDLPLRMPTRQPARAAFVSRCAAIKPRAISTMANTNRKNTGTTTANSTTLMPARGFRRRWLVHINFAREATYGRARSVGENMPPQIYVIGAYLSKAGIWLQADGCHTDRIIAKHETLSA